MSLLNQYNKHLAGATFVAPVFSVLVNSDGVDGVGHFVEHTVVDAQASAAVVFTVMMPARMEGIFSFVWSRAVTEPAQAPASMAAGRASSG